MPATVDAMESRAQHALTASPAGTRGAVPHPTRLRRAGRWAAFAVGALVLALAFASYLSPDMAFTLMTQAWSCL